MIVYEEKIVIKAAEQLFVLCGKDFRIVIYTSHNPLNANLAKPLTCFCPRVCYHYPKNKNPRKREVLVLSINSEYTSNLGKSP